MIYVLAAIYSTAVIIIIIEADKKLIRSMRLMK